jgi:hypothetical protein
VCLTRIIHLTWNLIFTAATVFRFYSNLKLNLTRVYKGIKWRRPPMADNLQQKTTSTWSRTPTEHDLQRKMTSKEDVLKIWNISAFAGRILLKFETWAIGIKPECIKISNKDYINKRRPQTKIAFHRKWPQNIKNWISQQPLVRSYFCQTPTPGEYWELTLLSHGHKKNNNKNDPHLNFPRRDCARVLKFCMRPSVI